MVVKSPGSARGFLICYIKLFSAILPVMKKWKIVLILALAQFVMVLDSTVMNVSISAVVADLGTTVNAMQAAITFYTLTMAAFMLIGAKLCAKWGLTRAFVIGSVVYGIGSLVTGLSQNITQLFLGWSVIEGLGAVLVIPAIAALIAANYKGKDRITAFAVIGAVSGAAAAAGPLIGGYVTTYLSWRYVFFAEVIIMAFVLLFARSFKASKVESTEPIDITSAVLSAVGMAMVVFGMLQSKVWGWIMPMDTPVINGQEIAPFGISIVAYLILFGVILLKLFYSRQQKLESAKKNPLLQVSMFSIAQLRSGLGVLMSQYMITAAVFFVIPIYLQMVLGYDALQTGLKIFPLSIALIIFSIIGTRMVAKRTPRQIVRFGQVLLVIGSVCLLASLTESLSSLPFAAAMFLVGAGLGLLASQLGNVNMSAVDEAQTSEVGGLQGVFQNLGSSLGTALIGSVMIASLTSGFLTSVASSDLSPSTKTYISQNVQSAQIMPSSQVESTAISKGATNAEAAQLATIYSEEQLNGLREAAFFLVVLSLLSIALSRNIPNKVMGAKA
jgi:EmrB/QacA subfamily drug resistance transporter